MGVDQRQAGGNERGEEGCEDGGVSERASRGEATRILFCITRFFTAEGAQQRPFIQRRGRKRPSPSTPGRGCPRPFCTPS